MTNYDFTVVRPSAIDSRNGPVAVSITPVSASKDSRSLKIAATLTRIGFRSVLFEGQKSSIPPELPGVTVLSVKRSVQMNDHHVQTQKATWPATLRAHATSKEATWVAAAVAFVGYLGYFVVHYFIGGLRKIPRASLYYLHEYSYFPAVWIKTQLYGAILIYDAHDFYTEIEPERERTRFMRLLYAFGRFVETSCIRRADGFATVSPGLADLYERKYGRRPLVLQNAHDSRLDTAVFPSLRHRIGVQQNTPTIVIVGQAKRGQVFSGVLGALKQVPEVHAVFVGNGYPAMIGDEVGRRGINDRTHFIEGVRAQQVVPLIREANASLMIYYSRSKNYISALPNGFFQSIAAGLPLFYGGLPELERVCDEFQCGARIDPSNTESVSNALRHVVGLTPTLLELRRSSERAAVSLSWKNEERKLADLVAGMPVASRHSSERN